MPTFNNKSIQGIIDVIETDLDCFGTINDKSIQGIIDAAAAQGITISDKSIEGIIDELSSTTCTAPPPPGLGSPAGQFHQITYGLPEYGTFIGVQRNNVASEPYTAYYQVIIPTTTLASTISGGNVTNGIVRIGIIRKASNGTVSSGLLFDGTVYRSKENSTEQSGSTQPFPERTTSYFADVIPINKGEQVFLCAIYSDGTSSDYNYRGVDPTTGFPGNNPFPSGTYPDSNYCALPTSSLIVPVSSPNKGIFAEAGASPYLKSASQASPISTTTFGPYATSDTTTWHDDTVSFTHSLPIPTGLGVTSGNMLLLLGMTVTPDTPKRLGWAGNGYWFPIIDYVINSKEYKLSDGSYHTLTVTGSLGTENIQTTSCVAVHGNDYLTGAEIANKRFNITLSPSEFAQNQWVVSPPDHVDESKLKMAIPFNMDNPGEITEIRLSGTIGYSGMKDSSLGISSITITARLVKLY